MTSEREVMSKLVGMFAGDIDTSVFAGAPTGKLRTRLSVLVYGYGARTQQVLANYFPKFRLAVGEFQWHEIGREFCYSHGTQEEQLGHLPIRFYEYLKSLNLSFDLRKSYEIDFALFKSLHARFDKSHRLSTVEQLQVTNKLALQETVILIGLNQDRWAVSRSQSEFFVERISEIEERLLSEIKSEARDLSFLAERLADPERLSHFLVRALSWAWLKTTSSSKT